MSATIVSFGSSKKPKIPADITQLLGSMDALSVLLESEVAALAEADVDSFASLQSSKRELCNVYERQLRGVQGLDRLEPAVKQLVIRSRDRLGRAMEQNLAALKTAEYSGDRVMQLIVNTVRTAGGQGTAYGGQALGSVPSKGPVSVTLNRTF